MKINILGYGVMGKQIASLFFIGGYDVVIWNERPIGEEELNRGIRFVKKQFTNHSDGSISVVSSLGDLEDNFTIEAVKEDLSIKRNVHEALKGRISKGYFSNTSSFSPREIGEGVNGLHFFNPISIRLAEIYLSDAFEVSPEYRSIMSYLTLQQFSAVKVNGNRGYLGNYILFNEISAAFRLIEKYDYSPKEISALYRTLYGGRDVFQIIDLIGIDVVFQILKNLGEVDSFIYVPQTLALALKKNILGKKNKTSILDAIAFKETDKSRNAWAGVLVRGNDINA